MKSDQPQPGRSRVRPPQRRIQGRLSLHRFWAAVDGKRHEIEEDR
jgi:hypothetical protein